MVRRARASHCVAPRRILQRCGEAPNDPLPRCGKGGEATRACWWAGGVIRTDEQRRTASHERRGGEAVGYDASTSRFPVTASKSNQPSVLWPALAPLMPELMVKSPCT